jgi:hypothetical protein
VTNGQIVAPASASNWSSMSSSKSDIADLTEKILSSQSRIRGTFRVKYTRKRREDTKGEDWERDECAVQSWNKEKLIVTQLGPIISELWGLEPPRVRRMCQGGGSVLGPWGPGVLHKARIERVVVGSDNHTRST